MKNFYIERADLLYELAKVHGTLEVVYQDLQLFKDGVGGEMPFMQMMTRESVTNSQKAQLLVDIAQQLSADTQQFIEAFVKEAQYSYVYRAIKVFEDIYDAHHLTVVTAVPLSQEQLDNIVSAVSKRVGKLFDTYQNKVDEAVIGGVRVQSKDIVIDTTLQKQLKDFQKDFSIAYK